MASPNLKYALVEQERRFLLASVPDVQAVSVWTVFDRYLHGTGMRLRMIMQDGQAPVYKLGQKVRLDPASARMIAHTTMYLAEPEYATLAQLPASPLHKTRRTLTQESNTCAIDAFHGELEGLVLAEIDLRENGDMPTPLPVDPLAEVTDDDRFTGGQLARTNRAGLRALLADYGVI